MGDKSALSLSFVDRQPLAAAAVLSSLDHTDAAAFLNTIPARHGAELLRRTASWPAALMMECMDPVAAGALIQLLPFQDASAILRLMPDGRDASLDAVPAGLKRDLEMSLSFPAESVGARMTPHAMALEKSSSAKEALALIRRSHADAPHCVFVVNDSKGLIGFASLFNLLRCAASVPLGDIMTAPPGALSARARLADAANHPDWAHHEFLPVLSRRKHLIGAISRKAVAREERTVAEERASSTLFGAMSGAYFEVWTGLARLVSETPPARPKGKA